MLEDGLLGTEQTEQNLRPLLLFIATAAAAAVSAVVVVVSLPVARFRWTHAPLERPQTLERRRLAELVVALRTRFRRPTAGLYSCILVFLYSGIRTFSGCSRAFVANGVIGGESDFMCKSARSVRACES